MLKKSFFPIFQYKLGFHANPPIETRWKKCVFPIYTLGDIKIHKIESLGTLEIKLEFYYGGGAWEPYLAPRLKRIFEKKSSFAPRGITPANTPF